MKEALADWLLKLTDKAMNEEEREHGLTLLAEKGGSFWLRRKLMDQF